MEKTQLTRKELYDLVWSESMVSIAKKFNLSDNGLRKICKKMEIPTPMVGHWAKVLHGKKVKIESLKSNYKGKDLVNLTLSGQSEDKVVPLISVLEQRKKEIEIGLGNKLIVPERLTNPDILIIKHVEIKEKTTKKWDDYHYRNENELMINVQGDLFRRSLRILDTLIKALKERGHQVIIKNGETQFVLNKVEFCISIREKNLRIEDSTDKYGWRHYTYQPTGLLVFKMDKYNSKEWSDGKFPLEKQLSKIIAKFEIESERKIREREEWRIRQEEADRLRKIEEDLKKRKFKELDDFKNLLKDAKRWIEVNELRDYIKAIELKIQMKSNSSDQDEEWLTWAKAKLDWFDPSVNKYDELLADFDRNKIMINDKSETKYSSGSSFFSSDRDYRFF